MGVTVQQFKVFSWVDENVLNMMVTQFCEYTKKIMKLYTLHG